MTVALLQLSLLVLAALLQTLAKSASVPDSTVFSDLLAMSEALAVKLDMSPEVPQIPNIFVPMAHASRVSSRGNNNVIPTPTTSILPVPSNQPLDISNEDIDGHHHLLEIDDPNNEDLLQRQCLISRTPTLPSSFAPALGVVRLFTSPSFKHEVGVVKGCGCMTLHEPEFVQSFVGSRNHSFAFFTKRGCRGTPVFQRFGLHYNLDLSSPIKSIRIVQGVLAPVPART